MMEAAEPRKREHRATYFRVLRDLTASRSLLIQSEMRSVLVIVADVLVHQALEMRLVEHDHMIEQIARRRAPTQRSATPFCHRLLRKLVRFG